MKALVEYNEMKEETNSVRAETLLLCVEVFFSFSESIRNLGMSSFTDDSYLSYKKLLVFSSTSDLEVASLRPKRLHQRRPSISASVFGARVSQTRWPSTVFWVEVTRRSQRKKSPNALQVCLRIRRSLAFSRTARLHRLSWGFSDPDNAFFCERWLDQH